jgi:hypothetical protein
VLDLRVPENTSKYSPEEAIYFLCTSIKRSESKTKPLFCQHSENFSNIAESSFSLICPPIHPIVRENNELHFLFIQHPALRETSKAKEGSDIPEQAWISN